MSYITTGRFPLGTRTGGASAAAARERSCPPAAKAEAQGLSDTEQSAKAKKHLAVRPGRQQIHIALTKEGKQVI